MNHAPSRPSRLLRAFIVSLILLWGASPASAQYMEGSIPDFDVRASGPVIVQEASPGSYFDQTGRKFAILGNEAGEFEAWAWPLKLFIHFDVSFFIGSSTQPIRGRDIVSRIEVRPDVTSITYVFQSFTATMHVVVPPDDAGGVLLLDVDAIEPLSVVASFVPTMQPMWPAGLGGQYARWDDGAKAYLISESSRKNHGYLGSPAGKTMSYTPAHMLGEQPNQFKIEISDPSSVVDRFIPIVMSGGKGDREAVRATYDDLLRDPKAAYERARDHVRDLQENTLSIETPNAELNDALEWAKFSYDGLFADNPDLAGTGMMAGLAQAGMGGRPGFGWFFGGDSYLNSFSLNALGAYGLSHDAITFMAPFQREDGKMPHEITQAVDYVDWFGDYPYAFIHADTSPYFIVAMHAYYEASGDWKAIESNWASILRAYEWSKKTDIDGDGLMDNEAAGLGALEFGALTGIQTDIYLGAVWIQALRAMETMASIRNETALTNEAAMLAEKAADSFEKFWDEGVGQYVYAFNKDNETVSEVTPWSAVGLMFGDGTNERATETLRRMHYSDMTTDWGVRMLSTGSPYYEPLNYNYGAVWPFLTSWVTTAQYKRGLPLQAFSNLMASVGHVGERSLGDVTEVFSGARHTWPGESVPHQGFCTAATVLPTVRGLLGLDYSSSGNTLTFAPAVPADWNTYSIHHFQAGPTSADIDYHRNGSSERYMLRLDRVGEKAAQLPNLSFRPAYQPGTVVTSVTVNGQEIDFETETSPDAVILSLTVQPDGSNTLIEVTSQRSLELIPPIWNSQVGDENKGLRILRYTVNGSRGHLEVEGRAGGSYRLDTVGWDRILSIQGAEMDNGSLIIRIPDSIDGDFSIQKVDFDLKGN
jgi:glycogen debranching enzyme